MRRRVTTLAMIAATFCSLIACLELGQTASASEQQRSSLTAAATTDVAASGGDLVTLSTPKTVRGAATLGSTWVSVSSPSNVPDGVTAYIVETTVRGPRSSGEIQVRPKGETVGLSTLTYKKAESVTAVSFVKAGGDGRIQLRASAGAPKVAVRVLAWTPATSQLSTPVAPLAARTVAMTGTSRDVNLWGSKAATPGSETVLLRVRTAATKTGTLRVAGRTLSVLKGTQDAFLLVKPDSKGMVEVKGTKSAGSARIQILGWTNQAAAVRAIASPKTLFTGRAVNGTRALSLASADIKAVTGANLLVSGPAGVTVSLWSGAKAKGSAPQRIVLKGRTQSVWLPVAADKITVAFAVTRPTPKASTRISFVGYVDDRADQEVSYALTPGSEVIGANYVVSEDPERGQVTLTSSAPRLAVGGKAYLSRPGVGFYPAEVSDVATDSLGRQVLTLQKVALADVFTDYRASYHGPVDQDLGTVTMRAGKQMAKGAAVATPSLFPPGTSAELTLLQGKFWSCSGGVEPTDVISMKVSYEGDANFDFSLGDASLDFSVKGNLRIDADLVGGLSVSCSVEARVPMSVPLGATGLALYLGGSGTLSVQAPPTETGGLFQLTGGLRFYSGYYYIAGETGGNTVVNPYGDASATDADGGSVSLGLALMFRVGVLQPPSIEPPSGPTAFVEVGGKVAFAPPGSDEDPFARTLRGGKCMDVTVGPYAKVGASLVIDFFPDVSFSSPEWEGPKATLDRGPCWGWTGTIVHTESHPVLPRCYDTSCTVGGTVNEVLTKTLIGQPAHFGRFYDYTGSYGSPISQPYNYTLTKANVTTSDVYPCYTMTFCDATPYRCETDVTANASGTVGWIPEGPYRDQTRIWVLDGYDSTSRASATASMPQPYPEATDVTGDPYCGTDSTSEAPYYSGPASDVGFVGPELMKRPEIHLTLTGEDQYHPEIKWSTKVDLVRHDYIR